jgi:hypothetical protein
MLKALHEVLNQAGVSGSVWISRTYLFEMLNPAILIPDPGVYGVLLF